MVLAVPLAEWVIPVAIMLLLYAVSYLLVKPLTWALQQIPVIGGAAAGPVAGMGATVVGWARGWLDSAAGGMLSVAQATIGNAYSFLTGVVAAAEWLVSSVAVLASDAASVPDRILAAAQAAQHYAEQLAATGLRTTAADLATAETRAAALVLGAEASAAAYVDAKAADVARLAEQAAASVLATSRADVAAAEASAATAVRALETTWAPQIATLQDVVGGLAGTLAGLGVASLALEVTKLATQVDTIAQDACPDVCGAMKPQLPTLQGLADVGLLLAVFGLAEQAIADPRGTAGVVHAAAGDLVTLGKDVAGLVGLQV